MSQSTNTSARPQRRRGSGRPAGSAPVAAAQVDSTPQVADLTELQAEPAPVDGRTFAELGVAPVLVELLDKQGISAPFPIQSATLPDSLSGRDVLGRGQTGSGKTLAFSLPLVQRLIASGAKRQPKRPRALILVPTRELANQVNATLEPLATALGLRTAVIFGGVSQGPQATALRNGLDVIVACPGRLEDLLKQSLCDLGAVEVAILDEADHMADLGFLPAVKRILDKTPTHGQRLLFSATLDKGIDVLVSRYLTNPVLHSVDPAVAPVSTMTHHVFEVDNGPKSAVITELASGRGRCKLFTRTKHGAKKLAKQLTANGVPAVDLHGNLAQKARERNLDAFSNGTVKVLVATDIAARGIHVDDIELVVHVDPPAEHKAYLHRSGRTARAGSEGVVVTIMTAAQRADVRTLARQAGIRPVFTAVDPGAKEIVALTGPAADYVTPAPVSEAPAQGSGSRGGGGGGGRGRSGGGAGGGS
ncbi:MAG: rhlE, partial [Friedmanniella sp.]|nr:rhlE [Friedmanniella sp.]